MLALDDGKDDHHDTTPPQVEEKNEPVDLDDDLLDEMK